MGIAIACVLLTACASGAKPPDEPTAEKKAEPVAIEKKEAPPPAPTTAVEPPEPEPVEEQEEDFALMKGEGFGALTLGMKVADLQAAVPGIKAKGKCEMSEATAESTRIMIAKKAGVAVGVICEGDKNLEVNAIKIVAPSKLESRRGIAIGDTAEEVKQAYGDVLSKEAELTEDSIVAGSIYGGLGFTLVKGRVVEMFLGAMAE